MVKEGFNCRLIRKKKKKQEGFSYVAPHEKLDLYKFTRCKYPAKKGELLGKLKAKMVSTAFACQFTGGCKF